MGGTRNPYGDTEREETTRIESDSVYVRCPSGTNLLSPNHRQHFLITLCSIRERGLVTYVTNSLALQLVRREDWEEDDGALKLL